MTTTLETLEAMESELQQETYHFLQSVRDDAQTYNPEDIADEEGNPSIDVRLQVLGDGTYYHHSGDAQYDTDHSGFWGAGRVAPTDDDVALIETARDLVEQVLDSAAQSE